MYFCLELNEINSCKKQSKLFSHIHLYSILDYKNVQCPLKLDITFSFDLVVPFLRSTSCFNRHELYYIFN